MLTLRKETDYALQLLKFLSLHQEKYVSLKQASVVSGISFLFLQKIARKLRQANLIEAEQGVSGGYKLIVNPKKISLKKVVDIMEGSCGLLSCQCSTKTVCANASKCNVMKKFKKINIEVVKIFDKMKLSDL